MTFRTRSLTPGASADRIGRMTETPPPPPPPTPPVPPTPGAVPPPEGYQPKEKLIAGLLGIFLGGFGIHSFYLGFTQKAIIQIVVTVVTCGVGSLWGLIEGIMYLVQGGKDAHGVDLV